MSTHELKDDKGNVVGQGTYIRLQRLSQQMNAEAGKPEYTVEEKQAESTSD